MKRPTLVTPHALSTPSAHRRLPLLRYLTACFALALLHGCSNTPPGQSGGKDNAAMKQAMDASMQRGIPTAKGKLKIASIGFQDDQFFKLAELGAKAAGEKNGADVSLANSGNSIDKEISLLDTYTTQKVNAIVIAPNNPKASIPALKRAHEAGIKIVTFDTPIDADFAESNIKSDQVALGKATGEEAYKYIQEKLGGKAKVAIISYMAFLPEAASMRTNGFKDEIKKLPGVEFVTQQDAWLAEKAVNVVENILTAHPDVNLIWAANEGGTVGAVTAVKNSGKAGKIVVFGTDMSEQMAGFLLADDNILQAVTGQKPFEIGSMALETAVKAVKGEKVEKKVVLPGQLFTRAKPDEVTKYRDYLHGLSK